MTLSRKVKYSFAYPFKTKTNVVLYSIVYSTPHLKGLEKIKDSIWKTFDGKEFYKNEDEYEKLYEENMELKL